MGRLHVILDPDLHERAKLAARASGRYLAALTFDALHAEAARVEREAGYDPDDPDLREQVRLRRASDRRSESG